MVLTKQRLIDCFLRKKQTKKALLVISLKMASSNLLVNKINSIVVFRMSELVLISIDTFPYRSLWVKEELVFSNKLQSMFLIVSRREGR